MFFMIYYICFRDNKWKWLQIYIITEENISRIGDLGAICLLVKLLSCPNLCEQDRLRIILTIGHNVDHSSKIQTWF